MTATTENFYALLQQSLLSAQDKPLFQSSVVNSVSCRQCDAVSARMANLFDSRGLVKGDRVLARTAKSPSALMLYLTCLRGGLIYVPVNPACTGDELDYFIDDARPALFIGDADTATHVSGKHGIPVLTLDAAGDGSLITESESQREQHEIAECAAADIAVMIYTSGTTGFPKGAMLSHGNLSANAATLYKSWGWSADDVLLHCLPIFHVHGLFVATHLALLGPSTMLFLPRFDPEEVAAHLPGATVFMGVPTHYTRLLQTPALDRETCGNMRLFISGSAPLLEETFHTFTARTGHTILERYGMSETGMLVSNPVDGERVAGTVGYPLPGVDSRVCDDQGKAVSKGEIGILQVRGANVFSGYWRKPALNQSEFSDGYFITGDLVTESPDGRLAIVGRNKDMVISGGLNIYPKEIEQVLDRQEGIRESAVFGVPHPDFGEGVVAAVVTAPGATPEPESILAACREHLAAYKVPKSLVIVDELPRNTMGKVQKNRLREQFAGLLQS